MMLLYGAKITLGDVAQYGKNEAKEMLCALNGSIDELCKSRDYLMRAVEIRKNIIKIVALVKNPFVKEETLKKDLIRIISKGLKEAVITNLDLHETTALQFSKLLNKYASRFRKKDNVTAKMLEIIPDIDMLNFRNDLVIWENLFKTPKNPDVRAKAKKVKANQVLMEELGRIYSNNHPKQYRGIPVHYQITSGSRTKANDIITVLLQALYMNNRIISKRVTYIKLTEIYTYVGPVLERLIKLSDGGCIVIDLFEESQDEVNSIFSFHDNDDWSFWDDGEEDKDDNDEGWNFWNPSSNKNIKKMISYFEDIMNNTQLIIVKNDKYMGHNNKQIFNDLKDKLNLIEIKEGLSGEQAQKRYRELMKKAGIMEYDIGDKYFEEDKYYSEEDVKSHFREFMQKCMTEKIYTEYSLENMKEKKKGEDAVSAKEELDRLIGLNDVKQIIEKIVALHKVNDMRSKYDGKEAQVSKHMLFSGNPGTAKTTVARLLAGIMKEEGLLKTGKFVECGRADLVGQFVGWTAVQVKRKFKEAKGGVLFIDEAYSLVDDSNSFGDEAINTIVAEMENMRDEIIVIFAGYPDKMQSFLDKNEGLKSRISHHVNFPNYSPDELLDILGKLAEDKGFVLNERTRNKVLDICRSVYMNDDYGNGRFARNLLEQAIMRQASRLAAVPTKDINKEQLFTLTEEDFIHEEICDIENNKRKIGFI